MIVESTTEDPKMYRPTALDMQEDRTNDVSEDFSKGNIELIERYKVASYTSPSGLCHIYRDGPAF